MFEIICSLKQMNGVSKAVETFLTLEIRLPAFESVRLRCAFLCMLMYALVFILMSFHVCVFCLPH